MHKQHGTIWLFLLLSGVSIGSVVGIGVYIFHTWEESSNSSNALYVDESLVSISQNLTTSSSITINGLLVEDHIRMALVDGDYWYDTRTGLYGQIGFPARGVMPLGLETAPVAIDASAGETPVIINNRRLPQQELKAYEAQLGTDMASGVYTLERDGRLSDISGKQLGTLNLLQPLLTQDVIATTTSAVNQRY